MSKPPPPPAAPFRQTAALPWRRTADGRLEVCLVTTRETKRWTIPKGWPMKGEKDRDAARIEAEQEAGVTGRIAKKPLGAFTYFKRRQERFDFVRVDVYALEVTKTLADWPEKTERDVRWMTPADAAILVEESELATLLTELEARLTSAGSSS